MRDSIIFNINGVKKVLFLDIDGVLNHRNFLRDQAEARIGDDVDYIDNHDLYYASMLDPKAIKILNRIIAETGAKVVVSSTWRFWQPLQEMLESRGFEGEIIGYTGEVSAGYQTRWVEIQNWIKESGIKNGVYVTLDDDTVGDCPWLVRTSFEEGLSDEHADRAIRILNSVKDEPDEPQIEHSFDSSIG